MSDFSKKLFGIIFNTLLLSTVTGSTLALAADACTSGGAIRTYNVSAIPVSMTLNRFGDHDPLAFMYVLNQNIQKVRDNENAPLPNRVSNGLRKDIIQPLVIRANLGECLIINFTNNITNQPASIHVQGLAYTLGQTGSAVGNNPGTMAAPGQTVTYQFSIPMHSTAEKAYYFHSHGASRELVNHGLFGAVVAEPAGSIYRDPENGLPLEQTTGGSNWEAIIDVPAPGKDFREFAIIYHEVGNESFDGILSANGQKLPVIDELTESYRPGSRALNYRSEPFRNRMMLNLDKSLGYSSYMFGDPSTPIPHSYLGEFTKTRLIHGGSEVFHVHHLHGGGVRWRRNPGADLNSVILGLTKVPSQNIHSSHLDSQTIGPGTSYNLVHECGAGGCQQVAGDFLYHCHIGHHYISGMWGFWRVFDTLQTNLAHLPDMAPPPAPVHSHELLFVNSGTLYEGKKLVVHVADPSKEMAISEWVERQLPPKGIRLNGNDATVWDWDVNTVGGPPLYLGEPEPTIQWANYASPHPGQRQAIKFNPTNGRYTWPLFTPHLAQRPPFSPNGHSGAPWLGENEKAGRPDGLCPSTQTVPGRQIRHYPITAISTPIPLTKTQIDPKGKLFVLNEDKSAILAGAKPKEPLTIRSNVGDCVKLILTNEMPDDSDNHNFSKVNMHSHFVQFDTQASDGVITGLSYEQSVRPFANEGRTLTDIAGTTITVNHVNGLRPGIWIGIGLGRAMCGGTPCTEIRRIESIQRLTLTLNEPLIHVHKQGEAVGVEFVQYQWYSDVDTGTVFFHTHVDFRQWDNGLFGAHIIEPKGSTYHNPTTATPVRAGAIADIHTPGTSTAGAGHSGSFREFVLYPHSRRVNDGVDATINLRAEPLATRMGDPAYQFSSVPHGDPMTPLLRAYVGDPVMIRAMGLMERVGGLRMTGHRFGLERFAGESAPTDTIPIGMSERMDVLLENGAGGMAGKAGDYLYYSTIGRDFTDGAWGLFRVFGEVKGELQMLPGHQPAGNSGFPTQTAGAGGAPLEATTTGNPCPAAAPVRHFDVSIFQANIKYNNSIFGIDFGGIMYSLTSNKQAILDGLKAPHPLVIRANAGECVEILLKNDLSNKRASLSLAKLPFDPQGSYGAAIGLNLDSTVAPGATRTHKFYADQELGTSIFLNLANIESLPRGAFGALVVEPQGASYKDPFTGEPLVSGDFANILMPNGQDFREYVTLFQDEDKHIGQTFMPYPEDVVGFTGINYISAPLNLRGSANNPSQVFNSSLFGDPATFFGGFEGDPVTIRVAQPWGEQAHVFAMEGHSFPLEPNMAGSEQVFSRFLTPGYSFEAVLTGGASSAGDYLYLDNRMPFLEAGLWGIMRVFPADGIANGLQLLPGGPNPGPADGVAVIPDFIPIPDSLKNHPAPLPANLAQFIKKNHDENLKMTELIQLGRAIFWDQQFGSDGQACASCHYHAGADARVKNTLHPGSDGIFSSSMKSGGTGGPNSTLLPEDFPFHKLFSSDSNDAVGSQGISKKTVPHSDGNTPLLFKQTSVAQKEVCDREPDFLFHVNGTNVRQSTDRNAPTFINAVYMLDTYWDGRAKWLFNGRSPFGARDPNATVLLWDSTTNTTSAISLEGVHPASTASQGVGPILHEVEMSCFKRTWHQLGRKLLDLRALQLQKVHPHDSVHAGLRDTSGKGLTKTYRQLIEAAFLEKYWGSTEDFGGFTQMEENMPFFIGMALMGYASTQVSDDSPFDQWIDAGAEEPIQGFGEAEIRGFNIFVDQGRCARCHGTAMFAKSTTLHLTNENREEGLVERMIMGDGGIALYDNGFYNIGTRPSTDDPGRGGSDPFGNPLSFTKQYIEMLIGNNVPDSFQVNPCLFQVPFKDQDFPLAMMNNHLLTVNCPEQALEDGGIPAFTTVLPKIPSEHPSGDPALISALEAEIRSLRIAVNGNFKVPTLRNVELTGPYWHHGGLHTLEQVMEFYNRGGDFATENSADLAPDITRLELTEQQQSELVVFLKTLTDERVRWQKAPFDHVQLMLPEGGPSDVFKEIPAVGKNGRRSEKLFPVIPFLSSPGDIDGDGDVDRNDMTFILHARNQQTNILNDPRDIDGDGVITALDARKVILLCTRSRCATK